MVGKILHLIKAEDRTVKVNILGFSFCEAAIHNKNFTMK